MLWPLVSAVFGLIVGSFLNVVINRLKLGQSLNGRSQCPHCGHELRPADLVPVASYLLLRGKCRYCGKPISIQYPLVEALTGLVYFLIALEVPMFGLGSLYLMVMSSFFIVIAVFDFKHYLILDKVVFPGLAVAAIYALARDLSHGCSPWLGCGSISGLLGALAVGGFFYLQHLVSKGRWIGFGDVKLGLLLGMAAGFPLVIFLLFASYTSGALAGLALIALGRKEMGSRLPFGMFLGFAAIFTLLYGQRLFDAYLRLIGL